MTDTSGLNFSKPFIDIVDENGRPTGAKGILQRWAYQYLLNPSVSNINLASGGNINAAGANINAKSVSLGIPLRPTSGGTGQNAAGPAAANGIGALAQANNLSDVASTSTSRTNLGLGTLATINSPVPVANGGTGQIAAGAAAANAIGALAESNNLSDVASAASSRTNLGLGTMATENSNSVAITGGSVDGTTVGATTASTGAFTTLSASSTVSGSGFSTYLASPPAIGGTVAAAGTFTTLTATSLTFGGTTLANYVEGTWTPTLVSSGGGTPTYNVQFGAYTRIGNRVLFNCRLTISALNTLAAGNLTIGGLPITTNNTANNNHSAAVHCNALAATATTQIQIQIFPNSTSMTLIKYSAGSGATLTQSDITGSAAFDISGHYAV